MQKVKLRSNKDGVSLIKSLAKFLFSSNFTFEGIIGRAVKCS